MTADLLILLSIGVIVNARRTIPFYAMNAEDGGLNIKQHTYSTPITPQSPVYKHPSFIYNYHVSLSFISTKTIHNLLYSYRRTDILFIYTRKDAKPKRVSTALTALGSEDSMQKNRL